MVRTPNEAIELDGEAREKGPNAPRVTRGATSERAPAGVSRGEGICWGRERVALPGGSRTRDPGDAP